MTIDEIIEEGLRNERNHTLDVVIDFLETIRDTGGCANCCVEQITKLRADMKRSDAKKSGPELKTIN